MISLDLEPSDNISDDELSDIEDEIIFEDDVNEYISEKRTQKINFFPMYIQKFKKIYYFIVFVEGNIYLEPGEFNLIEKINQDLVDLIDRKHDWKFVKNDKYEYIYDDVIKEKFKKVNSKIKVAYKQFDIGEGDNVRRQIMGEIDREIKEFRKYFIVKNPGVSFYFSEPVNSITFDKNINNLNLLYKQELIDMIYNELIKEKKCMFFRYEENGNNNFIFYGNLKLIQDYCRDNSISNEVKIFLTYNGDIKFIKITLTNQELLRSFNEYISNDDNYMIALYDKIHLGIINYLKLTIPYQRMERYSGKPEEKIVIFSEEIENGKKILMTFEKLWNELENRIYLWNDNNGLIGGNIESNFNNIWKNRKCYQFSSCYQYFIKNENDNIKFINFLNAFGYGKDSSPFIFNDNLENEIEIKQNMNKLKYKKVGFNNNGLVVVDNGSNWIDLYYMGFNFDPENNWWYKFPLNLDETTNLDRLGFKETGKSKKKTKLNSIINSIYLSELENVNTEIIKENDLQQIDNNFDDISNNSEYVSIYFDSSYNGIGDFTGSQINYYDQIKNLWVGCKLGDSHKVFEIKWELIKNNDNLKLKFEKILTTKKIVCYNMKALMVLLLKENINFNKDMFIDDLMLAVWTFNSNLEKINIERREFNCLSRYSYSIESIYKLFSRYNINLENYSEKDRNMCLYTIFPLVLLPNLNDILVRLGLRKPYKLEVEANKVLAKIENRGMYISKENLVDISGCLSTNLRDSIEILKKIEGKYIGLLNDRSSQEIREQTRREYSPYVSSKFHSEKFIKLNSEQKKIMFEPNIFYNQLQKSFTEFKEPYVRKSIVKGNREYLEAFILRNKDELNNPSKPDFIKFGEYLDIIFLILKYKWIYERFLPGIIKLSNSNEIHPCINPIAQPKGRINSVLPNIHFAPNTDKTKWGKYIRRSIQARDGFYLVTADWSAQELITLGILSEDENYIKSLNSGDQHVSTAVKIFKDQTGKFIGKGENKYKFNINDRTFESGEENTIYYMTTDNKLWGKTKFKKVDNHYILDVNENLIGIESQNQLNNLIFVSKKQRTIAKQLNFGLMYGMSITTLQSKLQIPREQMIEIVELWWKSYPSIKRFIDKKYLEAFQDGYISSIVGKRLYLPELLFMKDRVFNNSVVGREVRESAINYMNSGTAADWFKISLIYLDNAFKENNLEVYIVNTLHDEIIFEVKKEHLSRAKEIINKIMREDALKSNGLKVKSSIDICKWWDSCTEDEKDTVLHRTNLINLDNERFMCNPTIDKYKKKYLTNNSKNNQTKLKSNKPIDYNLNSKFTYKNKYYKYKMKYHKLKNKIN